MAIAPIDLQAIFSQVEKVGKTQAQAKEGQALHQAMQGVEMQRKTEEHIKQVNEAQNTGDGAEKVKDRDSHDGQKKNSGKRSDANGDDDTDDAKDENNRQKVLRDPYLGKKIDISY